MFKIIIVEDEKWEREGLVNLFEWNKMGIEIAGTAKNGFEGIELAKRVSPDIIITDIKMPGMDGLEMSKKIKAILPDTKIIILTGYDYFNYAKEAIEFNAYGYVLKPVEEKELLEVINRVLAECQEHKKKHEDEENLRIRLSHSELLAKDKLLADLLEGRLSEELLAEQFSSCGLTFEGQSFTVIALHFEKKNLSNLLNEEELNIQNLINSLKKIIQNQNVYISSSLDNLKVFAVLCMDGKSDDFIEKVGKEIIEQFYLLDIGTLFFAYGKSVNGIINVKDSYQQSKETLDFSMFWNKDGITPYREIIKIKEESICKFSDFLLQSNYFSKQILHCVRTNEASRINLLLEELFVFFIENKGIERQAIYHYLAGLINEVALLFYNLKEKLNILFTSESELMGKLESLKSLDALKKWILEYFQCVLEAIDDKNENKDEKLIRKVIEIIEQKYMKNINIKTISNEVFLTPNYLGSIFKKSTGKSINDYINEFRMEKARELLKSTKKNVASVAEDVGIASTSYFCVLFKSSYGMTPREYQEIQTRG